MHIQIQRFFESTQQSRTRYQSKFKLRDALFAIVKDVFPCSYWNLFLHCFSLEFFFADIA